MNVESVAQTASTTVASAMWFSQGSLGWSAMIVGFLGNKPAVFSGQSRHAESVPRQISAQQAIEGLRIYGPAPRGGLSRPKHTRAGVGQYGSQRSAPVAAACRAETVSVNGWWQRSTVNMAVNSYNASEHTGRESGW